MGTCNSIEVIESNIVSTQTFRGHSNVTIVKTYKIPNTGKGVKDRTYFVKIVDGAAQEATTKLGDLSSDSDEEEQKYSSRRFAEGVK